MFNITNQHGNADQKHMQILPHIHRVPATEKKGKKENNKCRTGGREIWNPWALLGMLRW